MKLGQSSLPLNEDSKESEGKRELKNKITEILKFIFFILLLPLFVASTVGFIKELENLPAGLSLFFQRGILIYLLIHLFIYEPQPLYQYGQNLVIAIFRFFAPLVKVAPFFLPIYSIVILILFYFFDLIFKSPSWENYFMFAFSFTLTMHMVFTAKALRAKDSNVVKPNYFFAMSIIYIVSVFLISLLFGLVSKDFSFPGFFDTTVAMTADVYKTIFHQLFVP